MPPAKKKVADKKALTPRVSKAKAKQPVVTAEVEIGKSSKSEKAVKAPKQEKTKKVKVKLIRDGFTMPDNEYAVFDTLKKRCLTAGVHAKKGELLRAALLTLSELSDIEMVNAVSRVEKLKTGRPAKAKQTAT